MPTPITILRPSSFQACGDIEAVRLSSFQQTSDFSKLLPSNLNTSDQLSLLFPSSFQQTSDRSSTPFILPSSFSCSLSIPSVGDDLGPIEWVVTPENPEPVQGS